MEGAMNEEAARSPAAHWSPALLPARSRSPPIRHRRSAARRRRRRAAKVRRSGSTTTSTTWTRCMTSRSSRSIRRRCSRAATPTTSIATATIGKSERFAYGSDPIEGVDVWKTRRPNAPVLIYLHGGSWQSGRSADFALYAEPYINAGAHFVSVDFTNVRATKGDLFPLVDQCRRAVALDLSQRREVRRRSRAALSVQPLVRQPSRRLRGYHRLGQDGRAAHTSSKAR